MFKGATYVGSAKCQRCHKPAFQVWTNTPHAHAYDDLVNKPKRPSLREFDGECVVCHVTGFGVKTGFTNANATAHLKQVGCESCHGPGSDHIQNKNNKEIRALMNPWRAKPNETPGELKERTNRIDQTCQKCHDTDNDVTWDFVKKWPRIVHPEPRD
jgi:hypothetical protein